METETIADIVRDMRECADRTEQGDEYAVATDTIRVYADRLEAAHQREVERLRGAIDKIEDQVRWTIAHIECNELDDATGALYTAHAALEHINRAKGETND